MTINDHWGYSADDSNTKTTRYLVQLLVRSASVGGNYLLNVGPTALGEIVPIMRRGCAVSASGCSATANRYTGRAPE